MALGLGRDRLAIGHARRAGVDLETIGLAQPLEQHAQMQLAQAVDNGLVGAGYVLDLQAGVLIDQLGQDFPHPLLVAVALGLDRQAMHGLGKRQRREVDVIVLGRVVQHRVEVDLVDLGHRDDVAGQSAWHFDMVLTPQHEQVADLERFAAVTDVQQAVSGHRSLMDPEDPHAADEGVHRDLEDMRQHMLRRVGVRMHRLRRRALAFEEVRWVGLAGVGQQLDDDVEQLGHPRTAARRGEAHGDQMPLAQRLLQRRMQLAGIDISIVEVAIDEIAIDFNHLLHQRSVRRIDAAEIAVAFAVEEAVHDLAGAGIGQVDRQAFTAEGGLDLREQLGQIDTGRVDAVDDDQAIETARGCVVHHPPRHRLDAEHRIDHDSRRLHGFQRRQALTQKVGAARGVDEVDARCRMVEMQHAGVQRVLHPSLERVVVAHRAAALQAARCADGAGACEQGLGKAGLAGGCGPDEGERSDRAQARRACRGWAWHGGSP